MGPDGQARASIFGIPLVYRELGAPGAPAILVLGRSPDRPAVNDGLIRRLAIRFNVIVPDLAGSATPLWRRAESRRTLAPRGSDRGPHPRLSVVLGEFARGLGLSRYAVLVIDPGPDRPVQKTALALSRSEPGRVGAILWFRSLAAGTGRAGPRPDRSSMSTAERQAILSFRLDTNAEVARWAGRIRRHLVAQPQERDRWLARATAEKPVQTLRPQNRAM